MPAPGAQRLHRHPPGNHLQQAGPVGLPRPGQDGAHRCGPLAQRGESGSAPPGRYSVVTRSTSNHEELTMPQDKAPADHPEHPSQLGKHSATVTYVDFADMGLTELDAFRHQMAGTELGDRAQAELDDRERHQRLIDKYRTPAE